MSKYVSVLFLAIFALVAFLSPFSMVEAGDSELENSCEDLRDGLLEMDEWVEGDGTPILRSWEIREDTNQIVTMGTAFFNGTVYNRDSVDYDEQLFVMVESLQSGNEKCVYGGEDIVRTSVPLFINVNNGKFVFQPFMPGNYRVTVITEPDEEGIFEKMAETLLITSSPINVLTWLASNVTSDTIIYGQTTFTIAEQDDTLVVLQGGSVVSNTSYGVRVDLREEEVGGLLNAINDKIEDAIRYVLGQFLDALLAIVRFATAMITSLLNFTEDKVFSDSTKAAWLIMRNLGISLLVFVLVIIAFANALQIKTDQYGINRMIPKIIIAIIMAYFSYYIVLAFFSFASALQEEAGTIMGTTADMNTILSVTDGSGASVVENAIGWYLLLPVVFLMIFVIGTLLFLMFMLIIRIVMLAFLTAVAPMAMILSILPLTDRWYKKWWTSFIKWLFMGPLVVMILALGATFLGGSTAIDYSLYTIDNTDIWIKLLMFLGAVIFAASLPVTMGGKIAQRVDQAGKKFLRDARSYGKAGTKLGYNTAMERGMNRPEWTTAGIKARWDSRQSRVSSRRKTAGLIAGARAATEGGEEGKGTQRGRFMAGVRTDSEARALQNYAVMESYKQMGAEDLNDPELAERVYGAKNSTEKAAALLAMEKNGRLSTYSHKIKRMEQNPNDPNGPLIEVEEKIDNALMPHFDELVQQFPILKKQAYATDQGAIMKSGRDDLKDDQANVFKMLASKAGDSEKLNVEIQKILKQAIEGALGSNPEIQAANRKHAAEVVANISEGGITNKRLDNKQLLMLKDLADTTRRLGITVERVNRDGDTVQVPALSDRAVQLIDNRIRNLPGTLTGDGHRRTRAEEDFRREFPAGPPDHTDHEED